MATEKRARPDGVLGVRLQRKYSDSVAVRECTRCVFWYTWYVPRRNTAGRSSVCPVRASVRPSESLRPCVRASVRLEEYSLVLATATR